MHQTFAIAEIHSEDYRTKTLVFDRALPSEPGQFVMAWLPDVDEKPYSIAGADPFSMMVVAVGPFSEALHALQQGDRLWIRGPLGQGFRLPTQPVGKHILLAGGGYGVAPLHFLAQRAVASGVAVDVCIGARTADDVLLVDAFERLGAVVHVTTDDGSLGRKGLVTAAIEAAMETRAFAAVYGCGPVPMLEAVERLCRSRGILHQLSWEARMRCGMGLCGECEVHGREKDGWLACVDGPVSEG
jgi:dihydroorotate dehydrogenase electron transfer subunit